MIGKTIIIEWLYCHASASHWSGLLRRRPSSSMPMQLLAGPGPHLSSLSALGYDVWTFL